MRKLDTKDMYDKDVTIYLTESQWRGLLRRFNEEEIGKDPAGSFYIAVPCALCVTFFMKKSEVGACTGCPLEYANCVNLLEKHGSEALSAFTTNSKIHWIKEADKDVRKGIRNLRKVLLSLPRVRRVK